MHGTFRGVPNIKGDCTTQNRTKEIEIKTKHKNAIHCREFFFCFFFFGPESISVHAWHRLFNLVGHRT